jgi:hypothetical protein
MRAWLREETAIVQVAGRRRIMEATALVEAYEKCQLTAVEANRKYDEYQSRWAVDVAKDEATVRSIEEEAAKISGARLPVWRGRGG